MKKARSDPQERRHVISVWLKRTAIALVLLIVLTGCATSGPEAQIPIPAAGAEPKELPSKGSPEAKVVLIVFCDFH